MTCRLWGIGAWTVNQTSVDEGLSGFNYRHSCIQVLRTPSLRYIQEVRIFARLQSNHSAES